MNAFLDTMERERRHEDDPCKEIINTLRFSKPTECTESLIARDAHGAVDLLRNDKAWPPTCKGIILDNLKECGKGDGWEKMTNHWIRRSNGSGTNVQEWMRMETTGVFMYSFVHKRPSGEWEYSIWTGEHS